MFNYKTLALAVASMGAVSVANAAGMDRSGQDVTAFLQDGTYGEVVYTYLDADVSGKDSSGNATGDVAEAYDFARFGVKADINDTFSVGVLYDEPFGAAVQYRGTNNFVASGADSTLQSLTNGTVTSLTTAAGNLRDLQNGIDQAKTGVSQLQAGIDATKAAGGDATALELQLAQTKAKLAAAETKARQLGAAFNAANKAELDKGEGTNVEIRTNNATLLMGAKLGQNKNFQVYGGPALQRLNGDVHLRGTTYSRMTGYDAHMKTDTALGWVAGVAYMKPEIALKAALTYRSEIEHKTQIAEIVPATRYDGTQDFSVTLPKSVNFDFQTGLNPTTLLTAKVRYVPWSDFEIRPTAYTATIKQSNPVAYPNGLPIVSYSKDQWSAEVGLGKKLNDKFSVQGSLGWDSGAGNPVSTLGPIKGYYSVGLGGKYNITPEWSASLGAKYFMFGDADAQIPSQVGTTATSGKFEDNDGYAVGLKLAYQKR